MTPNELYPSLVQMILHAENVSWNRFYNFLVFNTILVLAWAAVWVSTPAQPKTVFLITICVLGGISGIFWAALGYRGRAFLYEYTKMAAAIEADPAVWTQELEKYKPATRTVELRDSLCYSWAGSRGVLIGGPLVFTVFYGIMLFVSFT